MNVYITGYYHHQMVRNVWVGVRPVGKRRPFSIGMRLEMVAHGSGQHRRQHGKGDRMISPNREAYMKRRKEAEQFLQSERGQYAMACALSIAQRGWNCTVCQGDEVPFVPKGQNWSTVEDMKYLMESLFSPYLYDKREKNRVRLVSKAS